MGNLRTDNVSQESLAARAAELGLRSSETTAVTEAERRREEERQATLARAEKRAASPTNEED